MRRPRARLVAVAAAAASTTWNAQLVAAHPYPKDDIHDAAGFGFVMPRNCAQYCGMDNQYCCSSGEQCFTSNGMAGCTSQAGGAVQYFTTTWTETKTFTSTGSTVLPAATSGSSADCVPPEGSGWIACGSICCASNQYCASKNSCLPNGAGGATTIWTTGMTTYTSGGAVITTQFSAPYRVTSGSSTGTGTAIGATGTPAEDGGGGGGTGTRLSAGAIAGIVIGSIVGLILLILICACCIVRGLCLGVMGLLGMGKKDSSRRSEKTTTIEEERYVRRGASRPSSVHSRRDTHSSWHGRPSTAASRKEKSSGAGWLGLAGTAGAILLLLGLKRENKAKKQQQQQQQKRARSEISGSYWSDSYTSGSPSSAGTRRTRDTRRTRRTETTRVSRAPSSRRP